MNKLDRKFNIFFELDTPATAATCPRIVKRTIDVFVDYKRSTIFSFVRIVNITIFVASVDNLVDFQQLSYSHFDRNE